ncbi:hypothetical protein CHARACLAT_019821 [Characodon lateralis]|uniref:Uncharacterized protein n=1 Tax=Characodon lateralis TaxID=208331 RepID=A0ABU7EKN8_9TELE|nr:hypothetical protein [Characodon lateralis]
MNGNAALSVCSPSRLPLAIHCAEKGYIASAPDSLGRCGRPADGERGRAVLRWNGFSIELARREEKGGGPGSCRNKQFPSVMINEMNELNDFGRHLRARRAASLHTAVIWDRKQTQTFSCQAERSTSPRHVSSYRPINFNDTLLSRQNKA